MRFVGTRWSIVLGSLGAATLLLFLFERILSFLGAAFQQLPAQTPTTRVNPHGSEVYAALTAPAVNLSDADITKIPLTSDGKIEAVDPYTELIRMQHAPSFLVLGIAISVLLLAAVIAAWMLRKRANAPRWLFAVAAAVASLAASYVLLAYVTVAARRNWDEVFVFATQARNFAKTGIAAVPVTGPRGIAESSADVGSTIVAGTILRLFPFLQGETALVFAYVAMLAVLSTLAALALRRWFAVGPVWSILCAVAIVVLLPQTVLATGTAAPAGVATASLVVFSLFMLHALRSGKTLAFAIMSVVVAFVRWEYGIIAIIAAVVLGAVHVVRVRRSDAARWPRLQWLFLATPVAVFAIETVFRIVVFGAIAPSGVVGKSVGFDPGYIASGLGYLVSTSNLSLWPFVLVFAIVMVLLTRPFARSTDYLLVCAVVLIPLVNGIIAGADIFPLEWERYVAPSYAAVIALTIATIGNGYVKLNRLRFVSVAVSAVFLLSQFSIASYAVKDIYDDETVGRTSCLARAGLALARVVPVDEGIASAEVNTVAYFAKAPVTDLYGIIDPRTASVPPSPKGAGGDLFHRRSNSAIIYSDRPAAIYLYEGASCGVAAPTPEEDVAAWNDLFNSDITRFRAGDGQKLFKEYAPATIVVGENEIVLRALVRRDLLQ